MAGNASSPNATGRKSNPDGRFGTSHDWRLFGWRLLGVGWQWNPLVAVRHGESVINYIFVIAE
jgi:hypothetical protein